MIAVPVSYIAIGVDVGHMLNDLSMQIIAIKATLWMLSSFVDFDSVTWDDKLVGGMDFLANSVLQAPFFLMSLMRYITPTLDHM